MAAQVAPLHPIQTDELPQPPVGSPSPRSKLRRAPIADTLHESTAVQRLVEYFVVVSSRPKRKEATTSPKADPSPTESQRPTKPIKSNRKGLSWGRWNLGTPEVLESRQESPNHSFSSAPQAEERRSAAAAPQIDATDAPLEAKITTRYPLKDYDDNRLNPMITQFCYPSGDAIVPSTTFEMPRVHHFVLTNDRGRKVYGTCLTVWEEYQDEGGWQRRTTISPADNQSFEVKVQDRQTTLYVPKVLCLVSAWPYLTAFREYLAQLYRLATATNVMTAPLERYIVNICKEVPAPPPGAYEIQVSILDSKIGFWAPPAKLPIAYVALPYKILFECLDLDNMLFVWQALMMERKILLISSQYSILTVCCEILCSFLFPMRWSHLYVPLLPRALCPILDAPVPYLCGIAKENWYYAKEYISHEAVIVDLDRNEIRRCGGFPEMLDLPAKRRSKLETTLSDAVGHIFWRARGLETEFNSLITRKSPKKTIERLRFHRGNASQWEERLESLDQAFNLQYTPDSPNLLNHKSPEDEQSQWGRVQEAYIRFFVSLFKDHKKYLVLPKTPCSPRNANPSFDIAAFLAVQKVENLEFLTALCTTQHFDDFLTRRMYSPGEPDLVFFDQSIQAKLNRSKFKLKKGDTTFLQSAKVHKELKKLKAVEPNSEVPTWAAASNPSKNYFYSTFPDTFEERNFCTPRPIPKMISAEFDRQALLVSKLRGNLVEEDDDDDILEFYGGDYDSSPEVSSFTLFFFVYSAVVGREWQKYMDKRRELEMDTELGLRDAIDERDAAEEECLVPAIETVLPEFKGVSCDPTPSCIHADALCGQCGESGLQSMQSTLVYIGREAGDAYTSMFETTVKSALSNTEISAEDAIAELEEAKEVASAQLDLAFEVLSTMKLRGLSVDSDAYLSLMEACGRCGDTERALHLIEQMKTDGFVADGGVLAYFVTAFAHDTSGGVDIGQSQQATSNRPRNIRKGRDAYTQFLRRRFDALRQGKGDDCTVHSTDDATDLLSDVSSVSSRSSSASASRTQNFMNWFSNQPLDGQRQKHLKRRKRKATTRSKSMEVTAMHDGQLQLGESLLDFVYPKLFIDTSSDSCPQCSYTLSEDNVVKGWAPACFQDYTSECPSCHHRFVPRFVVSTSSPTFEGSQGLQTPLYCEFLSPWVVRKELQSTIKGEGGIDAMLDPDWRNGTGIRATLFWNLILLCRRYRLPFAFLLQGSFQNRLILPRRPNQV